MPSEYQKISDLAAQTSVATTSNTRRYLDFSELPRQVNDGDHLIWSNCN